MNTSHMSLDTEDQWIATVQASTPTGIHIIALPLFAESEEEAMTLARALVAEEGLDPDTLSFYQRRHIFTATPWAKRGSDQDEELDALIDRLYAALLI